MSSIPFTQLAMNNNTRRTNITAIKYWYVNENSTMTIALPKLNTYLTFLISTCLKLYCLMTKFRRNKYITYLTFTNGHIAMATHTRTKLAAWVGVSKHPVLRFQTNTLLPEQLVPMSRALMVWLFSLSILFKKWLVQGYL